MPKALHSNPANLRVLYEDNHLIVINKRAGDIVQGDKTGDMPLSDVVKQYLKVTYDKPGNVFLGVVHRLDRPTSGIVVFAKTSKALSRLNRQFAQSEVEKRYWAVACKAPPKAQETLTHWLVRNPKQNKSYAHPREVKDAKKAILSYRLMKELDRYFLLEIELETGRHHQIRAQLAAIDCVIKGDVKYGAPRSNGDASIHLHARHLTLEHPVKKEPLTITAAPPEDTVWKACL